jgi:hypothetical protein
MTKSRALPGDSVLQEMRSSGKCAPARVPIARSQYPSSWVRWKGDA